MHKDNPDRYCLLVCPVCGADLTCPAYEDGYSTFEICSCCGVEFGYHDFGTDHDERQAKWEILRNAWISSGCGWRHEQRKPDDWNCESQLERLRKCQKICGWPDMHGKLSKTEEE